MTFPLYDICNKYVSDNKIKELNKAQKLEFVKWVETIDNEKTMYLYIMIRKFSLDNDIKSVNDIYQSCYDPIITNGNKNTKNFTYDFDKLPLKLQLILYRFMKLNDST